MDKEMMTPDQMATELGITPYTVRIILKAYGIKTAKIKNRLYLDNEACERLRVAHAIRRLKSSIVKNPSKAIPLRDKIHKLLKQLEKGK